MAIPEDILINETTVGHPGTISRETLERDRSRVIGGSIGREHVLECSGMCRGGKFVEISFSAPSPIYLFKKGRSFALVFYSNAEVGRSPPFGTHKTPWSSEHISSFDPPKMFEGSESANNKEEGKKRQDGGKRRNRIVEYEPANILYISTILGG
jgi:hypothetical protein